MRLSKERVLIASTLLVFVFGTSFSAPKKSGDSVPVNVERPNVVGQAKKQSPTTNQAVPTKEPVQSTTDISSNTPTVIQPAPVPVQAEFPSATAGQAAAYSIDWFVIAAGGGSGTSTNYAMDGTVGQTAVGEGTSTNYELNSGFWQNFGPASCCIGIRGDCNNDGQVNPNILDLNFLVNRVFRGGPSAVCLEEADVNGNGTPQNIVDLNFLVNRIFRGGPLPGPCP